MKEISLIIYFKSNEYMYNFYEYIPLLKYKPTNSLFSELMIKFKFNVQNRHINNFIDTITKVITEYDLYNKDSGIVCDMYMEEI